MSQGGSLSFWRKLGGGSLSLSIIVHAVLLGIGVVWIIQTIPAAKKPEVDFMPKGGGGGSPARSEVSQKKKRATMTMADAPRVVAKGVTSSFTLPEPDGASSMSSVGALGSSSLSGGLGGSGAGGGRGDGRGTGFGAGMGPGLGGTSGGANPFGLIDPDASALVGTFFDMKQTDKRVPTDVTPPDMIRIVREFVNEGWRESALKKYYQAPQKLHQTRIFIPRMSADGAPAAFKCEKEVQPSRWMVIYRGSVEPPRTARYRFVGGADDIMVVRFNRKTVLDHGWTSGTTPMSFSNKDTRAFLRDEADNPDLRKAIRRDYPMKPPVTFYQYDGPSGWNDSIGGLAAGAEFEAKAGSEYEIEILISEVPGGSFGGFLYIEEIGATYGKTSTGSPILPLFRLNSGLPPIKANKEAPPFDPAGPIWKLAGKAHRPDI